MSVGRENQNNLLGQLEAALRDRDNARKDLDQLGIRLFESRRSNELLSKRMGELIEAILKHKQATEHDAISQSFDHQLWAVLEQPSLTQMAGPEAYARENANPVDDGLDQALIRAMGMLTAAVKGLQEETGASRAQIAEELRLLRDIRDSVRLPGERAG